MCKCQNNYIAVFEVSPEKLPIASMICPIILGLERMLQEFVEISSNHG